MPLPFPSRYPTRAAGSILSEVKKGNQQSLQEFIWENQEKSYVTTYLACQDPEVATQLTIQAFEKAIANLKQIDPRKIPGTTWGWLSQFVIKVCQEFYSQYGKTPPAPKSINADEQNQIDEKNNVLLSTHRLKRCLSLLPESERNVFVLRHQLFFNYNEIALVLNEHPDTIKSWLFQARIQLTQCLARR